MSHYLATGLRATILFRNLLGETEDNNQSLMQDSPPRGINVDLRVP
jgi:hypothetical protein